MKKRRTKITAILLTAIMAGSMCTDVVCAQEMESSEQISEPASEESSPIGQNRPESDEKLAGEIIEVPEISEKDESDISAKGETGSGADDIEQQETDADEESEKEIEANAGVYEEPGSNLFTPNWSTSVKCHVYAEENGDVQVIYSVLSGIQQTLMIDTFSGNGVRKSHKSINVPGTSWGGTVYQGPDNCYYITTGNGNDHVYYIQKYDSGWNLQGTASISGDESYTAEAFDAGNSSITMADKYLVVHTSRLRPDGHQSNTTFIIDSETMDPVYITGKFGVDHVSHSFNQFVKTNGNQVIMVDHGDAYPRTICLQAFGTSDLGSGSKMSKQKELSLMDIKGETGQNFTGVTVDGFELGEYNHVVAGSSIPHDSLTDQEFKNYDYSSSKNLYAILVDKGLNTSTIKWLTSYPEGSGTTVKNVHLIKVEEDRFVLLYGINKNGEDIKTCSMTIDSNGNILNSQTLNRPFYCTSEPSSIGDELVWCHYVESELGNFLVLNRWNIVNGSFSVQNLNIGVKSKIDKVAFDSYFLSSKCSVGANIDVEVNVYSRVFRDSFPTAPVVWTSSNPSVIEIKGEESLLSSGVYNSAYKCAEMSVKAKANGTATITASVGDKKASFKITVGKSSNKPSASSPKVKKISISGKKSVKAGKSLSLKAKVTASKGANKKLKWTSSNKKYAAVSSSGKVKTYKAGKGKKVKITAKATDGSGKKASITIKIK